jgi:hypothetical protein
MFDSDARRGSQRKDYSATPLPSADSKDGKRANLSHEDIKLAQNGKHCYVFSGLGANHRIHRKLHAAATLLCFLTLPRPPSPILRGCFSNMKWSANLLLCISGAANTACVELVWKGKHLWPVCLGRW